MSRAKELNILFNRIEAKNLRQLPQVKNTKDIVRDLSREAVMPGKRISKNGKIYWETRQNRSDMKNSYA